MIHLFSFVLGLITGFVLSTILIYYWIKRYISKLLGDKEQMLKNIINILESKRK